MNVNTHEIFRFTAAFSFEAAHFETSTGAPQHQRRVHGHSYTCEATVAGPRREADGRLVDLEVFSEVLKTTKTELDHKLLNELPGLCSPSMENIALFVRDQVWQNFERLLSENNSLRLTNVTVRRPTLSAVCSLECGGGEHD